MPLTRQPFSSLCFLQKKTNHTCPARLWEMHQSTGQEPRSLQVTPGASWGPGDPGFIQRLAKGAPQVNKLDTVNRTLATLCPFPAPPQFLPLPPTWESSLRCQVRKPPGQPRVVPRLRAGPKSCAWGSRPPSPWGLPLHSDDTWGGESGSKPPGPGQLAGH